MALTLYPGEEHQTFLWEGGDEAALLVHGFPGTPAEMRPLAAILHAAGWTVQGILLPGFGPQMASLAERTAQDWIDAVQAALAELAAEHSRVALIGFSMGGAVALNGAVSGPMRPDALVLLAPFTQLGKDWQQPLWPLLRLIFREIQPFKQVDFSDDEVQRNIANFLPGADFDDPEVQAELRKLSLPATIMDQLRNVGQMAKQRADQLAVPTLIVQGQQDELINPALTARLAARIDGRLVQMVEVQGEHQIIDPHDRGWHDTAAAVREFLGKQGQQTAEKQSGRVEEKPCSEWPN